MLEISGIGGLIILALDIWAIVSIIGSSASTGKKVLWVLLVLILPILGFAVGHASPDRTPDGLYDVNADRMTPPPHPRRAGFCIIKEAAHLPLTFNPLRCAFIKLECR